MFDRFLPCTASSPSASTASSPSTWPRRRRPSRSPAAPEGEPLYEFSTCSLGRWRAALDHRVRGRARRAISTLLRGADTVVVPAYLDVFSPPPAEALAALRAAAARGARVISVCTGAFALAHAGLLDGRRATTHWAFAEELARRFPAVEVDAAALYVDEGAVMTSAGLSAGIDLCLHVIREDCGAAVGERVARHMVAAPHREGGQAQFIERPEARSEVRRLAGGDPALGGRAPRTSRSTSPRWPRHASVSPRTFARRFREETGTTPLQWLLVPARAGGASPARGDRPAGRRRRLARRLRHRRLAARSLPPRHRDDPDRLPSLLHGRSPA